MLITLLRLLLLFLIAHTMLRVYRMLVARGRDELPPPEDPQSPKTLRAIDPGDVIDATYREVEDRPSP